MTRPLKLLDKLYKYEMDPVGIVKNAEQTRFSRQTDGTDRRKDRRRDKVKPVYPIFNLIEAGV